MIIRFRISTLIGAGLCLATSILAALMYAGVFYVWVATRTISWFFLIVGIGCTWNGAMVWLDITKKREI